MPCIFASLLFFCGFIVWCGGLELRPAFGQKAADDGLPEYLDVTYNAVMQPLVRVSVGGQWLNLVFDASSGNTIVFVKERHACIPDTLEPCYSYEAAARNGTVHICRENNEDRVDCETGRGAHYSCKEYLGNLSDVMAPYVDKLVIDGIKYDQVGVEAVDAVSVLLGDNTVVSWPRMSVRLLVKAMDVDRLHGAKPLSPLKLFEGSDGIFGASGPSLGCRNETAWDSLLRERHISVFAFDFQPPPQAKFGFSGSNASRVLLGHIDREVLWSQPKQTGDYLNDGMHEFLIYRPSVCGVDLLYNTSSNWLAVIDTSGPCLAMPPFLFDRLMTQLPVVCPFELGEASRGRLCSPRRGIQGLGADKVVLPTLYFQLEDDQDPAPPKVALPLERLLFRNASNDELLCVARSDGVRVPTADMMFSHIAFGSLVVSALYTVVNLQNATIGLAVKGDSAAESTDQYCTPPVSCISSMQTYYPPLNVCEDPDCGAYIFMVLDPETRMCKWLGTMPMLFGTMLVLLAVLDLASHRLYKQAIEKASDFCQ
mmetsp:Transcript_97418/g.275506  ORF Transcript_97418/g.275506 Transcript_97418/m.275506 type:complete len:539 (-) Transcript_97418:125-1741(-)